MLLEASILKCAADSEGTAYRITNYKGTVGVGVLSAGTNRPERQIASQTIQLGSTGTGVPIITRYMNRKLNCVDSTALVYQGEGVMGEYIPAGRGFFHWYFTELPFHSDNERQTFRWFIIILKFSIHSESSYCLHPGQITPATPPWCATALLCLKRQGGGFPF